MTRFVPGNAQQEVVLPDAQVKQPPNLTFNADVPHAGLCPRSGPPVNLVRWAPHQDSRMPSTCRLIFEPLRENHADELYEGFSDQATYRFIPGRPPMSIEAMRREYSEFSGGAPASSGETWLNWAVRESVSGSLVGKLQATQYSDGLLWVGYMFIPSAAGRGLGTEAMQWLVVELASRFPCNAPLAAVDIRNGKSIGVLQKSGFKLLRTEAAENHGEPSEDFIFQCPAPPSSEP